MLSETNAQLTLIPLFNGFVNDAPHIALCRWEENRWMDEQSCDWEDTYNEETGKLEYTWEHRDSWFTTGRGKNRCNYTASCEALISS